jgi:hypothetical protein
MRWRALVLVLVGSGCVSGSPSRAIHWKTLATSHSPADALASFSQPTASPDVCDARVANDLLVANDVAEGRGRAHPGVPGGEPRGRRGARGLGP